MLESASSSIQVRSASAGPLSACSSTLQPNCRRSMRRPMERNRQPWSRVMPSRAKPASVMKAAMSRSSSASVSETGIFLPRPLCSRRAMWFRVRQLSSDRRSRNCAATRSRSFRLPARPGRESSSTAARSVRAAATPSVISSGTVPASPKMPVDCSMPAMPAQALSRSAGPSSITRSSATRSSRAMSSQRSLLRPNQYRFSTTRLERFRPVRTRSCGPVWRLSRLKVLTGPAESTQVSLLEPPRCIEITRASVPVAARVRPPGITT